MHLPTFVDSVQAYAGNLYRPLVSAPLNILFYTALAVLYKYLPESKANPTVVVNAGCDVDELVVNEVRRIQVSTSMGPNYFAIKIFSSALGLSHTHLDINLWHDIASLKA